eukprot:5332884-Alexandrium_andersonii.AAC.1
MCIRDSGGGGLPGEPSGAASSQQAPRSSQAWADASHDLDAGQPPSPWGRCSDTPAVITGE